MRTNYKEYSYLISLEDVIQFGEMISKNTSGPNNNTEVFKALEVLANALFQERLMNANITSQWSPLSEEEIRSLNNRKKIEAIRSYRTRCDATLLEAKTAIENYMNYHWGVTSFMAKS